MPAVSEQTATNPLILEEFPVSPNSDDGAAAGKSGGQWWRLGEYTKSIVYGGMDAIMTCFSLISSIPGGRFSSSDVLVLGFANLIADGISMGFRDYVSSATENCWGKRVSFTPYSRVTNG